MQPLTRGELGKISDALRTTIELVRRENESPANLTADEIVELEDARSQLRALDGDQIVELMVRVPLRKNLSGWLR